LATGLLPSPIKVTVTARAELNPETDFFATGEAEKVVYCASTALDAARQRLGPVATVVDAGQPVDMGWISEDLYARGVRRLMVEGGGRVHTQFLTGNLADELHLVVEPMVDAPSTRVAELEPEPEPAVGEGRPLDLEAEQTLARALLPAEVRGVLGGGGEQQRNLLGRGEQNLRRIAALALALR